MLYHLFQLLKDYDFPGHGLMGYLSFRAMAASVISMLSAFFAVGTILSVGIHSYQDKKLTLRRNVCI